MVSLLWELKLHALALKPDRSLVEPLLILVMDPILGEELADLSVLRTLFC